MKLYVSQGTNPRVVELFLAEKGIELERVSVDIADAENRSDTFLAKNSLGQLPVLELDDGQCISQTIAICEYLEERFPAPALIGATPERRAETRMWLRRLDLLVIEPLVSAFKYSAGLDYYQSLVHCMPHAVDDFRQMAADNLSWLEGELAARDGESTWLCRHGFSLADIQLYCFLDFARHTGQPVAATNHHVLAWFERARRRLAPA